MPLNLNCQAGTKKKILKEKRAAELMEVVNTRCGFGAFA